jgi:hypothetical protein
MSADAANISAPTSLRALSSPQQDRLREAELLLQQTAKAGLTTSAGEKSKLIAGAQTQRLAFAYGPGPTIADILSSRPDWARGLSVQSLPGPFSDKLGRTIILGSVTPAPVTTFMCGGQAIGYFTGSVFIVPMPPPIPPQIAEFGAGTLWLRTSLVDPTSPADGLLGLTITFGLLTAPGVSLAGDTLSALSGTIVLVMAQASPAPQTTGDAAGAKFTSPGEVTVVFSPAALTLSASGGASASVYGVDLAATPAAGPARYVAAFDTIALPMALTAPVEFAPAAVVSPLFAPEGAAAVASIAWALPITHAPPTALADAEGPGAALLTLADGLSAKIAGEAAPTALKSWSVIVGTDLIIVLAARCGARASQKLTLWTQGDGANATIDSPAGSLVGFLAWAGGESLRFGCIASIAASAPITADRDGLAFGPAPGVATLALGPQGLELAVLAVPPAPQPARQFPFVLDNALISCGWPQLIIVAALLDGDRVTAAGVDFAFPLLSLLPTLPDPYATSAETPLSTGEPLGVVTAVAVALNERVEVGFAFNGSPGPAIAVDATRIPGALELLDVSTNADLFGVRLALRAFENFAISGLATSLPEYGLGVVTVPHISWEPLIGAPFSVLISPDDGPQTLLYVVTQTAQPQGNSVVMVQAEPLPALDHIVAAARGKSADLHASFTLPFGLRGRVDSSLPGATPPDVAYVRPSFAAGALAGGRQVSMRAPGYPSTVGISGYAQTTSDASTRTSIDPNDYGASVLGAAPGEIAGFFLESFAPPTPGPTVVPVNRIDASGYGASLFSHWHRDLDIKNPCDIGVDDVKFDVMLGRTNFEFIEAKSWLFPWCIPVVRSLTISRTLSGVDVRKLSDWQATDDSHFEILSADAFNTPLFGPIAQIVAVKNIAVLNTPEVHVDPQLRFARATFDADIVIDPDLSISKGAIPDAPSHIAAFGLAGFIQTGGVPCGAGGANAVQRANLSDVVMLLRQEGAASALISCAGTVKGSRLEFAFSSAELAGAVGALAGALRGRPILPADGAWSLARRAIPANAPEAIDPKTPVPLIRGGGPGTPFSIAEPADIRKTAPLGQPSGPAIGYGLLQDTGTQKVYFEQPSLPPNAPDVNFLQKPQLADASALLGAAGVFPDIGSLIAAAEQTLKADASGLGYSSTGSLPAAFDRALLTAGPVSILLRYRDTNADGTAGAASSYQVKIQPTQPRYAITIGRVSLALVVDGLAGPDSPLLSVTGTLAASDGAAPGLADVKLVYGQALNLITNLLSGLEAVSQFLPGRPKSGLSMTFNGTSLTVSDVLALPTIPLGIGQIEGVALDLGMTASLFPPGLNFSLSLSTPDEPFHWLVSPLSGNGAIGFGATDQQHKILVEGGIGVGLGVDFGIASGSASVCITVRVDQDVPPFEVTALLTGNAEVDVLDGLASASISLTAGVGLAIDSPAPPLNVDPANWLAFAENVTVTVSADVAVGIHISVCWLVHVDADETWRFQETISPGDVLSVL